VLPLKRSLSLLGSGLKTVQGEDSSPFKKKKAFVTCRIDGEFYWNIYDFGYRILDAHLRKKHDY